MIFLSGWALWLMSLGALVGLVYFLKRQAPLLPVSSLFLWRGIEQSPKSALRLRWTQILGLILQLLALMALVVSLAQPILYTQASGVQSLAIILDGSASMRIRVADQGPTRYQEAQNASRDVMRANPAAEVTIIQAQAHSALLVPPTKDHAQAERTLNSTQPTFQSDLELSDLLSLLQSQSPQGFERVVFLTDHRPAFDATALGWELQVMGGEEIPQNVAITRFAVRAQPNAQGLDIYLEAWNSSEQSQEIPLRITADDQLLMERIVALPPRETSSFTFSYDGPLASRYVAQLVTDGLRDDWSDDNVRYASPPQPRPWKILWIGESNFYLESFLRLSGYADLTTRPSWEETSSALEYDAILLSHAELPRPMTGRFLLLQSALPPWVQLGKTIDTPEDHVEVQADHPLLAGMDPRDWRLLRAQEALVSSQGQILLTAGEIPLLYVFETNGLRLAYLGIDLQASNLGVSVDFPILMYRLLSWLAPKGAENTNREIGQELPLAQFDGPVHISSPAGRSCDFPSQDGRCGFLDQPGFYELSHSEVTQIYAANGPSQESKLPELNAGSPSDSNLASSPKAVPRTDSDLRVAVPLWPYALMVVLLLLLIELWYFDRSFFFLPVPPGRRKRTS